MKTEKFVMPFLLATSPAMLVDFGIKSISPDFIVNYLGNTVSYVWSSYINLCHVLWILVLIIIAISFGYFFIKEKISLHKNKITVNDDMEYVLTEHQKKRMLEKEKFSISLIFNSDKTGVSSFNEHDVIVKFNVKNEAENIVEQELKDYFSKHFNKAVFVESAESGKMTRWERTITFI